MSITPATIATQVASELPNFFNDTFDQFIQGEGEYIRAGNPKSITSQIGQAVARAACRRYGSGNATPNAAQALRYERACRPYLNDIGLGFPARYGTPVRGGQCDGRLYIGRYDYDTGPLASPTVGSVTFRAYGPLSLGMGPISAFQGVALRHRGAFPVNQGTTIPTCGQAFVPTLVAPTQTVTVAGSRNGRMVSLTPCTGVDNCGTLPPEVDPIKPGTDPTPPPFRFNPNVNVDVDINVAVNVNGQIIFNIGTGDITVDPFPAPTGGGGLTGGDLAPTTPGTAGTSTTTGAGGEGQGTAPAGKELTGVLVEVLSFPPNAARFQNNSRQPFRGAGYVALGYPGLVGIDTSGGVFSSPQFFHAQQRGLTAYRTSANIGFNLRSTPYYRDIPE